MKNAFLQPISKNVCLKSFWHFFLCLSIKIIISNTVNFIEYLKLIIMCSLKEQFASVTVFAYSASRSISLEQKMPPKLEETNYKVLEMNKGRLCLKRDTSHQPSFFCWLLYKWKSCLLITWSKKSSSIEITQMVLNRLQWTNLLDKSIEKFTE